MCSCSQYAINASLMRLSTGIGINPQDRKGEERACALDGSQNRFLTTAVGKNLEPSDRMKGEERSKQAPKGGSQ